MGLEKVGRQRNRLQMYNCAYRQSFCGRLIECYLGISNILGHIRAECRSGALQFDQAKDVCCDEGKRGCIHLLKD